MTCTRSWWSTNVEDKRKDWSPRGKHWLEAEQPTHTTLLPNGEEGPEVMNQSKGWGDLLGSLSDDARQALEALILERAIW